MRKNVKRSFAILMAAIVIGLSGCGGEGKVKAPFESSYCSGKELDGIVAQLQEAGFTNIQTVPRETAVSFNDKSVINVKIGSNMMFNTANAWEPDVKIVVEYYDFKGENAESKPEEAPPESSSESKPESTPAEQPPEDAESLTLESILAALEITLTEGFGDHYNLAAEENAITANVWNDGVAICATLASGGDQEQMDAWNTLAASVRETSEQVQTVLNDNGYTDMVFVMQVVNDLNKDNTLLTASMGIIFYDCVNGINLL